MHTALVLGYSAFDLGLLNEKDIRLKIIKKGKQKARSKPQFSEKFSAISFNSSNVNLFVI